MEKIPFEIQSNSPVQLSSPIVQSSPVQSSPVHVLYYAAIVLSLNGQFPLHL